MSIVHRVIDNLPSEGDVVYCDNGKYSSDRAIYKDGQFLGGGEFPVKEYAMSCVSKWFNLDEYRYCKNSSGYRVSFDDAELMSYEGYEPKPKTVREEPKPYSKDIELSSGRVLTIECIRNIRGKLDKTDMSKDYAVSTDVIHGSVSPPRK